MKTAIAVMCFLVHVCVMRLEPIYGLILDMLPTPDPCGYQATGGPCVKHRVLCPVW